MSDDSDLDEPFPKNRYAQEEASESEDPGSPTSTPDNRKSQYHDVFGKVDKQQVIDGDAPIIQDYDDDNQHDEEEEVDVGLASGQQNDNSGSSSEEEYSEERMAEMAKEFLYNDPDCSNNIGRSLRVVRMQDVQV